MHVNVLSKTANALNASDLFGIMVDECSNVRFVLDFSVKMISSSIKRNVKFWSQKIINVDRVINLVNGVVYR